MKEEELIATMRNMFKNLKKEDEGDKFLFFSPKYSPVVKVSDWFLPKEADPKDNNPYNPPGGNYFLSTYYRLGNEPCNTPWETTTQAMLRQIRFREAAIDISRPLVPPTSELLLREEKPIICRGLSCRDEHFLTTYDKDFQQHFPYKVHPTQPEISTSKRFGLNSFFTPTKICETKFLDDNEVRTAQAIICDSPANIR